MPLQPAEHAWLERQWPQLDKRMREVGMHRCKLGAKAVYLLGVKVRGGQDRGDDRLRWPVRPQDLLRPPL